MNALNFNFSRMWLAICLPFLLAAFDMPIRGTCGQAAAESMAFARGSEDLPAASARGLAELHTYTNALGMTFVAIPPGNFQMGSPADELGRMFIFEKQHLVRIEKVYYLQTTEVTQGQWEAVMGENPAFFSRCGRECPVESVSWFDVQQFIRTLNRMDAENRYRLPTEAEWEYACRSGSTTAFSNDEMTGVSCEVDSRLDETAWYACNADGKPHPVGLKNPNSYGLYDMHGNVYEWCQNMFAPDYSDPSSGIQKIEDPGGNRTLRSCSWYDPRVNCRSASRTNMAAGRKNNTIGFRLVRESRYYKIDQPIPVQPVEKANQNQDNALPAPAQPAPAPESSQPAVQVEAGSAPQYAVQVESTTSLDYARQRVDHYTRRGFPAGYWQVIIPDKGTWYRVCLGGFASAADAKALHESLARQNIKGIVIKTNTGMQSSLP